VSVSATTRPLRAETEVEGRDYYFLVEEEFQRWVRMGAFLEWATFSGYHYGTPRGPVFDTLEAGLDVVLEIELDGARQIVEQCPDALMIFVMPPSLAELERRLRGRGTESEDSVCRRMARAQEEIAAVESCSWAGSRKFDYVIVNDSINRAADELTRIVERTRKEDE
jgi:guanylate kinase